MKIAREQRTDKHHPWAGLVKYRQALLTTYDNIGGSAQGGCCIKWLNHKLIYYDIGY